jgi:hypothetical protein
MISSSSKLVSDYDLARDETVSCGPDYIRLHAHHRANASYIQLQACQTTMWCGKVRQNLVRTRSSCTISEIQYARAYVCSQQKRTSLLSVQIMQYAVGLVLFAVLLRHALNHAVHKFSKKKI